MSYTYSLHLVPLHGKPAEHFHKVVNAFRGLGALFLNFDAAGASQVASGPLVGSLRDFRLTEAKWSFNFHNIMLDIPNLRLDQAHALPTWLASQCGGAFRIGVEVENHVDRVNLSKRGEFRAVS